MIYFLYGQDSYRSKQKLQEIIEQYKKIHKSGLNLIYFNAKESDFKDFFNNFKITSMFDEKKLIILKEVFSNKNFQEEFLENIHPVKSPRSGVFAKSEQFNWVKKLKASEDIIVVYEKDNVDERSQLFKAFKKEAKCQDFSLLSDRLLKIWLKKEFEKYGTKIDYSAENLLLTFAGNDLWQMANEVKKLAYFKKGSLIRKEDIELQVKPKIENDIFKTIDAMASKNKKQALNFLYKHLEAGDNPLYILSMIAYQFRTLLIVKELMEKKYSYDVIAKKSGLHPFVARKSYYLCQQFTMAQLKKIYQRIFQIDSDIKTGRIEPETALNLLVAEI